MKYCLKNQVENKEYKICDIFVKDKQILLKNEKILSLEGTKLNINITLPDNIYIDKVNVKKGSLVKNGDLLFTFTPLKGEVVYASNLMGNAKIINVNKDTKTKDILSIEGGKLNINFTLKEGEKLEKVFVKKGDAVNKETPLYSVIRSTKKEIKPYDLVVIGSGPGGYVGAIYAAKKGLKTAIIEEKNLGGTCLNVGCIPTKVLFETSAMLEKLETLKLIGINVDKFILDFNRLSQRKSEVIRALQQGIEDLLNQNNIDLYKGTGIINDNKTVLVNKQELKTKNILIATGSKHTKINIKGEELCLNSTSLLSIKKVPKELIVIGGGVVGMEFGYIFNGLGSKVTVLEYADHVLNNHDSDVSSEIERIAKEKGIKIQTFACCEKIEKVKGKIKVTYTIDGKKHTITGNECLMSIGREPNLTGLDKIKGLEILPKRGGVKVDKYFQTSIKNIYAIGDCINTMPLAHVASYEAKAAIDNMQGSKKTINYDHVPFTSFTNPEVSGVGIFDKEAKKRNIKYKSIKFNFKDNSKAYIENDIDGFIKLTYDIENKYIIGGQIVGSHGDTLLNAIVSAIRNKETAESLNDQIFAHPTVGETLNEAYLDLIGLSIHKHD